MKRFIERQNIAYLERLLAGEAISEKSRHLLEEQLLAAQRRLAMLTAVKVGVVSRCRPATKMSAQFRDRFEAAPMPLLLLDPGPGMHIVHANDAYAAATMVDPDRVAGEKLFNVFPDNPGDPFADGAANVFDSLRIVAETGETHAMAVQRYDVRNPEGAFVERYWRPVNSPVLDDRGDVLFILNEVVDMTPHFPREAPWRQHASPAGALRGNDLRRPASARSRWIEFVRATARGYTQGIGHFRKEPGMKLDHLFAVALASTLLLAAPARAQTYDPAYPVCLQVYQGFVDYYFECAYQTMAQCQMSASGRSASCVVNPYYRGPKGKRSKKPARPAGY